jgi:hypothetical protein
VDVPAARASTPALSEGISKWPVAGADQEILIGIDMQCEAPGRAIDDAVEAAHAV